MNNCELYNKIMWNIVKSVKKTINEAIEADSHDWDEETLTAAGMFLR